MGRQSIWSERKIEAWEKEGCGEGEGANYKPWLEVADFSSLGRSRRVWGHKVGRIHHLFSDVEWRLFLALEWDNNVLDIREQFPLLRPLTQDIARECGIDHPCYPGTRIPAVMTVDFLVTKASSNGKSLIAFNAKRQEEGEDERSLLKLEIQRRYFEAIGVQHHLIYHSHIPIQKVTNIEWIRSSVLKEGEIAPQPGFYTELCSRMAQELTNPPSTQSLNHYCTSFDMRHGLDAGVGLRTAKLLMVERSLQVDLSCTDLANAPLSSFLMTECPGNIRAIGGL
jgi:hypothetical protein